MAAISRFLPLLTLCLLLQGCNLPYYWQAARGQLNLLQKRQDIHQLLADPDTSPKLKNRLEYVLQAREFAKLQLHLSTGDNYLSYADLKRPYVVWNVFATPELSMQNEHWCFPIAGCVPYRGYFAEKDAQAFAETLAQQGFDTYVGGVAAYSTLGWFDDAVLNTFIYEGDLNLAALIFHELAHRTVYVPNDATFNESFATTVEDLGLERWIEYAGLQQQRPAYELAKKRQKQFLQLVLDNRAAREKLFASPLSEAAKRRGKQELEHKLKQDYLALRKSWGGYDGYDAWFNKSLNNAQLSTIATYYALKPAFLELFRKSGGDFASFLQRCRELAKESPEKRDTYLKRLAAAQIGYTGK